MTTNTLTTFAQRRAAAARWLRESGWTPDSTTYDYAPLNERARKAWYPGKPARAASLIAAAARWLRGDHAPIAPGRPRLYRRLAVDAVLVCPHCGQQSDLEHLM